MRWLARLALASILALAAAVAAWQLFVAGAWVRWSDAYEALDASYAPGKRREGRDEERLRLANAAVDGEAPQGMPIERRLHAIPSLVQLRYEQLNESGGTVATYELRALVPALPYFGMEAPGSQIPRIDCPQACREALARGHGTLLATSGEAGIADEWLLRMPLGIAFDLGRRSIRIRDIAERKARSIPYSHLRVTMRDACPATVREGKVTTLEFHENATIPVPKEFRTHAWVQMDGCARLMAEPPPPMPANVAAISTPDVAPAPAYGPPPEPYLPHLDLIHLYREGRLGHASLVVEEGRMARRGEAMLFTMRRACRYEPNANRWEPLALPPEPREIAPRPADAKGIRVAYEFPRTAGLYWAQWSEGPRTNPGDAQAYSLLVQAGPEIHCDPRKFPPQEPDTLAICVPRALSAEPRRVPDPERTCAK